MENKLSKFIKGFRKLYGTQHSIVIMQEKLEKSSRQKGLYLCLMHGSIKGLWYNQSRSFVGKATSIWFL